MGADDLAASSQDGRAMGVSLRLARTTDVDRLLPMMNDFNRGEGIAVEPARLRAALTELLTDDRLGRVGLIVDEQHAGAADPEPAVLGYAVLTFGYDLEYA